MESWLNVVLKCIKITFKNSADSKIKLLESVTEAMKMGPVTEHESITTLLQVEDKKEIKILHQTDKLK